MGLPSSVLSVTNDYRSKKAKLTIISYIVITVNGYTDRNTILFITICISLYKGCLILKRNDFILIMFQILFQRWLYNKLSQSLVITGISAE